MTIYFTGRGDKGKSAMGARKISKDDPLFDALGSLDELNSWVGLCRAQAKKMPKIEKSLLGIQETLFIVQAELGMTGMGKKATVQITSSKTTDLEDEILEIDKVVPQIKQFIIPGASELSANLDIARAVTRRVERDFVAYSRKKKINPEIVPYLNRLSSLLFALARMVNFRLKLKEDNPKYQ